MFASMLLALLFPALAADVVMSASSGRFESRAAAPADVSGLAVTITTTGRPVRLELVSAGTGAGAFQQGAVFNGTGNTSVLVTFTRDGVPVSAQATPQAASGAYMPSSSFAHTDFPPAGSHTYSVQAAAWIGGGTLGVYNTVLIAREL